MFYEERWQLHTALWVVFTIFSAANYFLLTTQIGRYFDIIAIVAGMFQIMYGIRKLKSNPDAEKEEGKIHENRVQHQSKKEKEEV